MFPFVYRLVGMARDVVMVRFDDASCEGISPLGYWQEVNQSPTQTKPYNNVGKPFG